MKRAVPSVSHERKIPEMDYLRADPAKFIVVEGNVGVGKSTLVDQLAVERERTSSRKCYVLPEPVNKPAFKTLLGRYYPEPARWGMTFQMYVLKERFKQHTFAAELAASGIDVVQDRSIYADGCFGHCVRADGNMDQEEWDIYADMFGALKRFLRYPDAMLYLRAEPKLCLERIKERSRKEECMVQIGYLERLHDEHEGLAAAMAHYTRVLVLDWTSFPTNVTDVNNKLNKLLDEKRPFIRDFNSL